MKKEITPISALNLLSAKDKKALVTIMREKAEKRGINLREKGVTRKLIHEGLASYNQCLNDARKKENGNGEVHLNRRKMRKALLQLNRDNPEVYAEQIKKAKEGAKKKKWSKRKSENELVFPLVVNCINSAIIAESKSRQLSRPDESKEATPVLSQFDEKKIKKKKIIKIFEKAVKKLKV